jgi:hypothetical protein
MLETMYCTLDEDRIPRFLSVSISRLKDLFAEHAGANCDDVVYIEYENKYRDILIGHFEAPVSYQEEKVKMFVYDLPVNHL